MSVSGWAVLAAIDATEDAVAEAYQYVGYLDLAGPRDGESVHGFRERIAGELRARGMVMEAHEALRGRRYDAADDPGMGHPDSVLTGVAGAGALALGIMPPARDGLHQVGDEVAAGVVALNRDRTQDAVAAAFALLGPDAAMDLFGGGR